MRVALLLLVAVIFLPLLLKSLGQAPELTYDLGGVAKLAAAEQSDLEPDYQVQFASSGATREVHSAVQVALANGNMRAFWYGGKREGAKDVSIYTAELDVASNQWRDERVLVERLATAQRLGIYLRKVGNPVTFRDSQDRLWLFFVTVSVGGWAGSTITYITSEDEGQNWSAPTRLVTSPIFNLSTLVKGEPFLYADGSIGLPVYHEMMGKFGELLRLSPQGKVLDKTRLMAGRVSLQPVVLPSDGKHAQIFMRNATDGVESWLYQTRTEDGGQSWSSVEEGSVPNPNAAVTGLRLDNGALLMVLNNQHDKRNNLSLMYSEDDGKNWQVVHEIEQEENTPEKEHRFAYPALRQAKGGDFHVLYTWNVARIRHVRFSQEWLAGRLEELSK